MRIVALVVFMLASTAALPAQLTLSCLNVGQAVAACQAASALFAEQTGHTVRVVAAEAAGRRALDQYTTLFAVKSDAVDVLQFSDGWGPALQADLSPVGLALDSDTLPSTSANAGSDGRTIGLPQFLSVAALYTRRDLLGDPASTWTALRDQLLALPSQGPTDLSVAAGDTTLFPFMLDWLFAAGVEDLEDRGGILAALTALNDRIEPVAAPGLPEARLADAAVDFGAGNTAALIARSTVTRNLAVSGISEDIDAQVRPGFEGNGQDGGPLLVTTWLVGVSRYSDEPDAARELAQFLASPEIQKLAAVDYGLPPTLAALYEDADVRAAGPIVAGIGAVLSRLRAPPIRRYGRAYLELADGVSETVRAYLRREMDADAAANAVARASRRALRGRGL